jgi:transcriptional regulator with XRE-family HTH domain
MSEYLVKWITDRLTENSWSMRELSRRSGITHSYISKVLSGKVEPGAKFYLGVAQAFELSIEALQSLDEGLPFPPDDAVCDELVAIVNKLPPAVRREVLAYAHFRYDQDKRTEREAEK